MKRIEAEIIAMSYLNTRQGKAAGHYPRLFDCGELGIMLIDWKYPAWSCRWFELEGLPDDS